ERFLVLNTRIFGPSTSPTREAVTAAPVRASPRWGPPSPPTTARTRSKRTVFPSVPERSSTSTRSPGETRYCLPPLSITAYIGICSHWNRHAGVDGGTYHKPRVRSTLEWSANPRRQRHGRPGIPHLPGVRVPLLHLRVGGRQDLRDPLHG